MKLPKPKDNRNGIRGEVASNYQWRALDDLQAQWDAKLACLHAADAAKKLNSIMREPSELRGKVIAGKDF